MSHRRSDFVDLDHIARSIASLRSKYGIEAQSTVALSRRSSIVSFSTINQGGADGKYMTSVKVGTPPQTFDVQLDTGSSDVWFATTDCTECADSTPKFNVSQSSTLNATSQSIRLIFGSGDANGTLMSDTVTLGPYTVPGQVFTGVTQISDGLVNGTQGGLVGLAFQGAAYSGATPFWQALIDAGDLSSPEMSFYLTRFKDDTPEDHPGGTFTLGGTDSRFYKGDIEYTALRQNGTAPPRWWLQTLSSLTLNGQTVDIGGDANNSAAIDTGTQYLGGPTNAVRAFWAQINGSQALTGDLAGLWQYPCATNLSTTLSFGGKAWSISADDMNIGQITEDDCIGPVFDIKQALIDPALSLQAPDWVIGDTFLKNVYSVFRGGDNPAVGFAELADGLNN